MTEFRTGKGEILQLNRACAPRSTLLLSLPAKYRCIRCDNTWLVSKEPPICQDQTSHDNILDTWYMSKKEPGKEKILFLGLESSPLIPWLREQGEEVIQTAEKLSFQDVSKQGFSFLISYGYRYILRKDILDLFPNRSINLHISYLPYNRGADPNFWSFIENTTKGITIHYLDEGVDTGDIIVQKKVAFDSERETLATSYQKLQGAIQDLFKQNWRDIKTGCCTRRCQIGNGSTHRVKDKESLSHFLTKGWDTPVLMLEQYKKGS